MSRHGCLTSQSAMAEVRRSVSGIELAGASAASARPAFGKCAAMLVYGNIAGTITAHWQRAYEED